MPRARSPNRNRALEIYRQNPGIALKKIAELLGESELLIRKWKSQDQWDQAKGNVTFPNGNVTNQPKVRKAEEGIADKLIEASMENTALTAQQREFCLLFVARNNATQAYKKAYQCSYQNACGHAHELLKNVEIQNEIKRLKTIRNQTRFTELNDLVEQDIKAAFLDVGDYVEWDERGNLTFQKSTEVDNTLIKEIKVDPSGALQIKFVDRNRPMERLYQYFKENPPVDPERENLMSNLTEEELRKLIEMGKAEKDSDSQAD